MLKESEGSTGIYGSPLRGHRYTPALMSEPWIVATARIGTSRSVVIRGHDNRTILVSPKHPHTSGGAVTGVAVTGGPGTGAAWIGGIGRRHVHLRLTVPRGKVSGLMGVMNLLQHKFNRLEITLLADEGSISEQEYEDKIREAFRQLGIEVGEE